MSDSFSIRMSGDDGIAPPMEAFQPRPDEKGPKTVAIVLVMGAILMVLVGWGDIGNSMADEYPDAEYPVVEDGKYKGVIGVGGLVLARVPEEIAQQRAEYYAKQHSDKVEAMDNDLMKEQHPSMPIDIDRQSRVTFGGSKKS